MSSTVSRVSILDTGRFPPQPAAAVEGHGQPARPGRRRSHKITGRHGSIAPLCPLRLPAAGKAPLHRHPPAGKSLRGVIAVQVVIRFTGICTGSIGQEITGHTAILRNQHVAYNEGAGIIHNGHDNHGEAASQAQNEAKAPRQGKFLLQAGAACGK